MATGVRNAPVPGRQRRMGSVSQREMRKWENQSVNKSQMPGKKGDAYMLTRRRNWVEKQRITDLTSQFGYQSLDELFLRRDTQSGHLSVDLFLSTTKKFFFLVLFL